MGRHRLPKYDEAYQFYQDGMSMEEVAFAMGMTKQAISIAFKLRGLPVRSRGNLSTLKRNTNVKKLEI
jgi:predicted DNA-binding protein YlxM (UPF0122 family)